MFSEVQFCKKLNGCLIYFANAKLNQRKPDLGPQWETCYENATLPVRKRPLLQFSEKRIFSHIKWLNISTLPITTFFQWQSNPLPCGVPPHYRNFYNFNNCRTHHVLLQFLEKRMLRHIKWLNISSLHFTTFSSGSQNRFPLVSHHTTVIFKILIIVELNTT